MIFVIIRGVCCLARRSRLRMIVHRLLREADVDETLEDVIWVEEIKIMEMEMCGRR
jgi:hypothetical protein